MKHDEHVETYRYRARIRVLTVEHELSHQVFTFSRVREAIVITDKRRDNLLHITPRDDTTMLSLGHLLVS